MCVETAQAGEREMEQLAQALTATGSEFQALQIRNIELLRVHNELTVQFRRRVSERGVRGGGGLEYHHVSCPACILFAQDILKGYAMSMLLYVYM